MSENARKIVIFDLDGTLALCDHRRHFVQGKGSKATKEDWRNFYAACVDDEPNLPVIAMNQALCRSGYLIAIFSGRSSEVENQTREWIERHGIRHHYFFVRPEGDYTPDEKLKEQWLAEIGPEKILCVFDDRQKVVDMWRSKGITCFQVAPGDF
ncbi:MAG TPA: hypothetical protein VF747_03460 [Blastocatellia bacterium]|jgi:histidinol phosphatase-like enzyme